VKGSKKMTEKKAFFILLAITIIDLIIPDPIPGIDEVILTLSTIVFGGKLAFFPTKKS
jgi:hypothetical protein